MEEKYIKKDENYNRIIMDEMEKKNIKYKREEKLERDGGEDEEEGLIKEEDEKKKVNGQGKKKVIEGKKEEVV